MLEYGLLVEAERLADAAQIDRMYHQAKLTAAAFAEPERIWREHEQVRNAILTAPQSPVVAPDNWLERVAAIHRKMQRAGLIPQSGAVN